MTDATIPTLNRLGATNGPDESCGDFSIRIGRDGTWYYHESPIRRPALAKLFSTVLRREPDGTYWLVTPAERGRIIVDDVPFVAVEMQVMGTGRAQILTFRTNLDDRVEADESHPIRVETDPRTAEPSPYILIRAGLEARLSRSVFYQLVDLGGEETVDGNRLFGVWSNGKFFPLGDLTAAT
jgi:uncharacterized protein